MNNTQLRAAYIKRSVKLQSKLRSYLANSGDRYDPDLLWKVISYSNTVNSMNIKGFLDNCPDGDGYDAVAELVLSTVPFNNVQGARELYRDLINLNKD